MGSSVAAGPGIPDSVPGQSCGRSTNNYAHLIATDLGLALTEVSCSGAIIDNVASVPQGTNPLQIAALTPDTRIVTISMGGNDVRYSASLIACGQDGANGTSCLGTDVDTAAINQLLTAERSKLVEMLRAVKQAAPGAKIFLVANTMMLPDPPVSCPPRAPFQAADATFLGMLGKELQDSFVAAAQEADVHFVDVYGASEGHDVCAPDGQRWVEGQTPPAVVPYYHPNATGMRAQADLIEADILRTF
jgi:lysophospholipase L1-like esterase